MKNTVFVLGARDPEMQEIEAVLIQHGIPFVYATLQGRRVASCTAYKATGVSSALPETYDVIFVECEVMGLPYSSIIDHHRPGDPGYGMPPERFMEGSSLGQLLAMLGKVPSLEQRVMAAADHCLAKAYQGRCPGVTSDQLALWRQKSRCANRRVSEEQLLSEIAEARIVLEEAPRVPVGGLEVAWTGDQRSTELSEASARFGIPYMFRRREVDGRMKAGIVGAPASVIQTWMRECGLDEVYGDPERGYAGGYFEAA